MRSRATNRRGLTICLGLCLAALCAGRTPVARAQIAPGQTIPSQIYFNTFPLYYDGNLRAAMASFATESRGAVKTVTSQWIDSICYLTMVGECHYQLGQLPAALESYDAALKLYVAYSDWMMRVQFPPLVVPAPPGMVRATPWGQSRRGARAGQFPETYLMGQGQFTTAQTLQQGGVIQQPILFPVHVSEVVRATCLAIRRRRELLGPIGKADPLTNDLVNVLVRRPGARNHWSEAWIDVQLGCAYAAAGDAEQARNFLQRALLVGGEFDHPLTSTALLELGRLALETGDFPAAIGYFEETTFSSMTYLNLTNMEEAFRYGVLAHLLLNQKSLYPPLAPAMAWAKTQGYRHLQTSLALLAAENRIVQGETQQAAELLTLARSLAGRSDLAISTLGARTNHLAAATSYHAGSTAAGDQALAAALDFQRGASIWNFQIGLTDARYSSGRMSDRAGLALYATLLRDPTPGDWAYSPLECLAVLTTPHDDALEHWFEAALESSKEQELALEIADRARRHRFHRTLPMGGRLLALRWILEGPPELVGRIGLLERQELLNRYPAYRELAQKAVAARTKLAAMPLLSNDAKVRDSQAAELAVLADIGAKQEVILREIAVRREPSDMVFPPLRKTADVQKSLADGQVLMAFFQTRKHLYGFLYSKDQYATWRVQAPAQLAKQVATLLREMGNYEGNHELTRNELTKETWRAAGDKVLGLLLARSNVDLAGNFNEIAIVPDGFLWYLPFEALFVGREDHKRPLLSMARVRYAPTVGLAVPYARVSKPRPNVGVVVGKLFPRDDDSVAPQAMEQLGRAVPGAVALPDPLPAASSVYRTLLDGLVVLDDMESTTGPYDWSPAQIDRDKAGGSLASWFSLPWGGPDHVILPGYHTAAENGLRKISSNGEEIFLSLCGLLSSGTRTVLISRWRSGGQTSFDLVREFAQELPHTTPAEAWQRSVQIAVDTRLEPEREPRLQNVVANSEPPKAAHPFFWAGYMLVDSGAATTPDPALAKEDLKGQPAGADPKPADPNAAGPMPGALIPPGIGQQIPGAADDIVMPADVDGPADADKRANGAKPPVKRGGRAAKRPSQGANK